MNIAVTSRVSIATVLANPADWILDFTGPFTPSYPNTYGGSGNPRFTWLGRIFPKTGKRVSPGIFFMDCHKNSKNTLEIGIQCWQGRSDSAVELPHQDLPENYDLFDLLDVLKERGFEIHFCSRDIISKHITDTYNPACLRQEAKDRLPKEKWYQTFIW